MEQKTLRESSPMMTEFHFILLCAAKDKFHSCCGELCTKSPRIVLPENRESIRQMFTSPCNRCDSSFLLNSFLLIFLSHLGCASKAKHSMAERIERFLRREVILLTGGLEQVALIFHRRVFLETMTLNKIFLVTSQGDFQLCTITCAPSSNAKNAGRERELAHM